MRAVVLTKLMAIRGLDKMTGRMIVSGLLAPETQRRHPEIGADLAEHLLGWDRRGVISSVRSVLVDRDSGLDAFADVRVPVLVVSGKEDHTVPSIHSQRIAEHLPGARHVEVAGAAHLVPLEKPEEANSLIANFLTQLPRTQD
jgi:3-oxoadipate enol-lactonase